MPASRSACRASASPSARRNRRWPMRASASRAARAAGSSADHRSSRREAHADDHAGADACGARHLLRHRRARSTARIAPRTRRRARPATSAPRCSRRSPRRSPPTSASRSPRSACRCMAAWASSRRPAPRSIYRDARIAPIYEGTNGIQAIDLVTRKLPLSGGAVVRDYLDELRTTVEAVQGHERSGFRRDRRAACAKRSTALIARRLAAGQVRTRSPTRRSPARRPICGCSASAAGGCMLAEEALAALRLDGGAERRARRDRALLCREHRGAGAGPGTHRHRRRRQRRHRAADRSA